jgi:cellulose biosynthesis protein BcsQ
LDLKLRSLKNSDKSLKKVFKIFKKEYDFIFIDCPPNITFVSENILKASDIVLEPCIPTVLSMLTHEKLYEFMKRKGYKQKNLISFFSMYESRKKLHNEIINSSSQQKGTFLESYIPYNAEIEKMGLTREPIFKTKQSQLNFRYKQLWEELKTYF